MDLSNLKPAEGATKKAKRIGRGQGSGRGGTSTRGHKGAQSRSGYSRKFGFEGGQMPLQRRVPKRGFKNPHRVEYRVLNLSDLQHLNEKFKVESVDPEFLHGIRAMQKSDRIKVLGNGELKAKVTVKVHAISEAGRKGVEAAGGTVEII